MVSGMKKFFDSDADVLHQSGAYLERPRLHKLLKKAMGYPLVVVCAGAGYGKTRAVYSFLREYDAQTAWLQLSERDNVAARFWENYVRMISSVVPEAGALLAEIGFPESDEAFAQYSAMMREAAALPQRRIRVFDDCHLLSNPAVLRLFERLANNTIPLNMTKILIARSVPDFNLIDLMQRGCVYTIHEEALCFTEDEITAYFSHLKLSATRQDIRNIYDDTQGWAFAVNLIGRSLIKERKYERYALDAVKKNIFRLMEAEIFQTVSEPLWRFLLRLSLIDHLDASLMYTLAKNDTLIKEMESLNSYIRYDFHMDSYLIHHLLLDYLRQKQDLLAEEEKRETYRVAGVWCDANGYHMDALSYYEKSGDYNAITRKIASFNVQMPPDMARYTLELFERAPDDVKSLNQLFPGLHIRLKINLGQLNEETIALARSYAEEYETRPDSPENNRALFNIYAHWALLHLLRCTCTDVYDFDVYYKKMGEYFDKNPFKTIGTYKIIPIIAWISLVGTNRAGAQEEYIAAVSCSIPDASNMGSGCFIGLDDLARGELCFLRGEFDGAEQYLKQAYDKACTCDQYVTQNRALVYLMQIAFFQGDFASANSLLRAMEALLSGKDYGIRYTIYDIAYGFYHLALGQPELAPEWLKGDFSPYAHPSFIENYGNRAKAHYHYQTRQYSALLAFIENGMEQQTILFGTIELKVLQALSFYQLKRRVDAIAALAEAYHLAEPNKVIALFIQHAKDMRTLTAAALKDATCPIPKRWLEDINRKSSAYAKRKAKMLSEYRLTNNFEEGISLTEREIVILKDLSQGLSRTEIAASRNISVNTVKMVISIIYDKLYVASLPDAIRVAVDRKII